MRQIKIGFTIFGKMAFKKMVKVRLLFGKPLRKRLRKSTNQNYGRKTSTLVMFCCCDKTSWTKTTYIRQENLVLAYDSRWIRISNGGKEAMATYDRQGYLLNYKQKT